MTYLPLLSRSSENEGSENRSEGPENVVISDHGLAGPVAQEWATRGI